MANLLLSISNLVNKAVYPSAISAESDETSGFAFVKNPGTLVPVALCLCALWVIMGIKSSSRKMAPELEEVPVPVIHDTDPALVDPFR